MFGLCDSCKGFRLARFSRDNKNELSEVFFFGGAATAPSAKGVFVTREEGWTGMWNGDSERWRRPSGLGWLVDLGSLAVDGVVSGAVVADIVFLRHSVIVSWHLRKNCQHGKRQGAVYR
jgi:hypothetical protein